MVKDSAKTECPFKHKVMERFNINEKSGLVTRKKRATSYKGCFLALGMMCVGEDKCPIMKK